MNLWVWFQALEQKLKKKISDLQSDKRATIDKLDEQMDRIADLEGVELSLRQKLKYVENAELNQQSRFAELEQAESAAKLRTIELENINETLSERFRKTEEEKASLIYEVSDLELCKEQSQREVERLKSTISSLQERLVDYDANKDTMQKTFQELIDREVELQGKLSEHQHQETEWREKAQQLERGERKLHQRIQEMAATLAMSESRLNAVADHENEYSFLNLQLSQLQRDLEKVEEDKHNLEERVKQFEYSTANHQMATLPKSEVAEMRANIDKMQDMERRIDAMNRSEQNLRDTIKQLRAGKNACGHDMEIADLKEKTNQLNVIVQVSANMFHSY